ncbi:hypothetical protein ACHQM5_005382 [Ranunculus cassubicifolius]
MEKESTKITSEEEEEIDAVELILFQVPECYVYMIPPRISAASYRADEWDVNKWNWEGSLKVVSKGEECIIKLEDKTTGELYARAFQRNGEQHPVEPVIDSSRYLNKKKTAEEMEEQYQNVASVDYSLKEGETIVLKIKNKGERVKSSFFEQGLNKLSLDEPTTKSEQVAISLKLPPPAPLSPVNSSVGSTQDKWPPAFSLEETRKNHNKECQETSSLSNVENPIEIPDDDFGDFQTAG